MSLCSFAACHDFQKGLNCFHFAVYGGHRHVAEVLVARGADTSATDTVGSMPLVVWLSAPFVTRLCCVCLFGGHRADARHCTWLLSVATPTWRHGYIMT